MPGSTNSPELIMAPLAIQKTSRRPSFFGTSMVKSFRRVWAGSGDAMIMLVMIKLDS
jgi:hypothetical protein